MTQLTDNATCIEILMNLLEEVYQNNGSNIAYYKAVEYIQPFLTPELTEKLKAQRKITPITKPDCKMCEGTGWSPFIKKGIKYYRLCDCRKKE